ncbi:Rod shape-determining protein RodA [compost metagenome]
MNRIGYHDAVREFLHQVCEQVKAKEVHKEIKLELESHLTEMIEDKMSEGLDQEQAITVSIEQMGDPVLVGKQLHLAHKPSTDWILLGSLIFMIGFAIMAAYAVQIGISERFQDTFVFHKAVYLGTGILVMLVITFFDYRKLKPLSGLLYFVTALGMIYVASFGNAINGKSVFYIGIIYIDIVAMSPYLFIIALAGLMTSELWHKHHFVTKLALFVLLPSFLYMKSNSYASFLIYLIGFMILLYFSRKQSKAWLGYLISLGGLFAVGILSSPYRVERLLAYYNPQNDPLGVGYMTIQTVNAIQGAGLWGHGWGAPLATIPYIHSDLIFTYMIHCLGWMMGLVIIIVLGIFIMRLVRIAISLRDTYGRLLVIGLTTIFAIFSVWSILMSVGIVPLLGISLPFISYGGLHVLMEFAAVGVVLSVYRRKNMMSSSNSIQISN